MSTPNVDKTVISLHKERLRREQKQAVLREKVARGVEKVANQVPVDPILERYESMVALGTQIALQFSVEDAKAVRDAWIESVKEAETGTLGLSSSDIVRWISHRDFAVAFFRVVALCHGYDEDGEPSISSYVGIMDP